jgi:hypothetical protein
MKLEDSLEEKTKLVIVHSKNIEVNKKKHDSEYNKFNNK